MSEDIVKPATFRRLPWDYWVYQVLAVLVFIPMVMILALHVITYPTIEVWALAGLVASAYGGMTLIIIYVCAKLKEGRDFSIAKLIYVDVSRSTLHLEGHRYMLGFIIVMLGTLIRFVSGFYATPLREPITLISYAVVGIGCIYVFLGGFTKSLPSTKPTASD